MRRLKVASRPTATARRQEAALAPCEEAHLDSQAAVQQLALEACVALGSLMVNGTVDSLSGLMALESVTRDVRIVSTTALTSLHGLGNLTQIGGDLVIEANAQLTTLEGLDSLVSVGGSLYIEYNPQLQSLQGLEGLVIVGGLEVKFNDELVSLDGLESLGTVWGDLEIDANGRLQSLHGLQNLTTIADDLEVSNNAVLTNLDGLERLSHITGELSIEANPSLAFISGLQGLASVGSLELEGNPALLSLDGLGQLHVWGSLNFNNCPSLDSLAGLAGLHAAGFVRVTRSNLRALGLSADAHDATIRALYIDAASWPACATPHEHDALLDPAFLMELSLGGLPEVSWETWFSNSCGPGPFRCTMLMNCSVVLDAAVGEEVSLSGLRRTCGPCHEAIAVVGEGGVVELEVLLEGAAAGVYSLCRCSSVGPLGQLELVGPKTGQGMFECLRGTRSCSVVLQGVGLAPGDELLVMDRCRGTEVDGNRLIRGGDGIFRFGNQSALAVAFPSLYQLCWRPLCDGCEVDVAPVQVGALLLAGPFPSEEKPVKIGQEFQVRNVGLMVSEADRLRLLPRCGEPYNLVIEAWSHQNMTFRFSTLTPQSVQARDYRKCWCKRELSNDCTLEEHFVADVGTLPVVCPEGQEREGYDCVNCREGHYRTDGQQTCQPCGKGKTSSPGARDCFKCPAGFFEDRNFCVPCFPGHFSSESGSVDCLVCNEGHFAKSGQALCTPCAGRSYALPGSFECTECQFWQAADPRGCRPDISYLVPRFLGICSLVLLLVKVALMRQPISVVDVSRKDGVNRLVTLSSHSLHVHWRSSFPIVLEGTGNPGLRGMLQARPLSSNELELLSADDQPLEKRLDTSMGTLTLQLQHELWHKGWPLPLVVQLLLLMAHLVVDCLMTFFRGTPLQVELVVTIGVALPVVGAVGLLRINRRPTPLDVQLAQFRKKIDKDNPCPVSCPKGPGRAIRLRKLFEVLEYFEPFIRDRTAYYLDSNILKPLTRPAQLSYAELVGPADVEWFVSHYWGTPFRHFCHALLKHAETASSGRQLDVAYWVCFCSNNQYRVKEELGVGWEECSFFITLQSGQCKGTCMVLDDEALPLTRSWCIFELLQTLKLERSGAEQRSSKEPFQGLLFCTSTGVLNWGQGSTDVTTSLVRRVVTMDLGSARASQESDRTMIHTQVLEEFGSFQAMKRLVDAHLQEVIAQARAQAAGTFADLTALINGDIARSSIRCNGSSVRASIRQRVAPCIVSTTI